jgi:transcriptional regulator with XRE-family HTH domain
MTDKQLQDNRLRIGERILQLREEKGMTQQQVADAAGLFKQNIARIEKGHYSIGLDVLTRVTGALGCEVEIIAK